MSRYDQFSEQEIALLRARAKRVSQSTREDAQEATLTALLVAIHQEVYALPIESILAVYRNISITPVPCVPPFVAGIANVRGHILPVLALDVLLNVPGNAQTGSALITVQHHAVTVALHVEMIGEVNYLRARDLAPVPSSFDIDKPIYLQGVLPDGTVLLNIAAILSDPDLVVNITK